MSSQSRLYTKRPSCSFLDVAGRCFHDILSYADHLCRHIHVSLRDKDGRNTFAVSEAERETGRADAAYKDTKFISQEAEWFLAGILDGIADGERYRCQFMLLLTIDYFQSCPW